MNYKRRKPRRWVRCAMCTPHRSGNSFDATARALLAAWYTSGHTAVDYDVQAHCDSAYLTAEQLELARARFIAASK